MAWSKYYILVLSLLIPFEGVFSQEYTMPSFVHAIDACDMDMDGSNDIIVSCGYKDSIAILFNDGYGNFYIYYFDRITSNLICGCFDSDDIPDIITGKEGYLYFIKSYGDQTIGENVELYPFSGSYTLYNMVDIDSDGWNDILYKTNTNSHWGFLKNNGNLTLTDIIIYSGNSSKPDLGNLNSDDLPDIVVSLPHPDSETKVLINDGTFNFTSFTVMDLVISDPIIMESDSDPPEDLVLLETPSSNVYFYKNLGNSNFEFQGNSPLVNAYAVLLNDYNDYNNDGFGDICYSQCPITGCNDSIYIALNSQNWSFNEGQAYYIGTLNWFRIKSSDLNGDSYPDLYMTGYNSNNKIKILWNNGDGTFSYLNPVGVNNNEKERTPMFIANPNPFINSTSISFQCENLSNVSLKIIDIHGFVTNYLIHNQKKSKGIIQLNWDGTNNSGKICNPGIYILILEVNGNRYIRKLVHY